MKITKGDLSMVLCKKCKLLQLEHNFDSNEMYGDNYGYMSSLNKSMEFHLKIKAINLIKKYNLKPKNSILEIRAGTGGDEASLFASDLLNMYQRYADLNSWKFDILSISFL